MSGCGGDALFDNSTFQSRSSAVGRLGHGKLRRHYPNFRAGGEGVLSWSRPRTSPSSVTHALRIRKQESNGPCCRRTVPSVNVSSGHVPLNARHAALELVPFIIVIIVIVVAIVPMPVTLGLESCVVAAQPHLDLDLVSRAHVEGDAGAHPEPLKVNVTVPGGTPVNVNCPEPSTVVGILVPAIETRSDVEALGAISTVTDGSQWDAAHAASDYRPGRAAAVCESVGDSEDDVSLQAAPPSNTTIPSTSLAPPGLLP